MLKTMMNVTYNLILSRLTQDVCVTEYFQVHNFRNTVFIPLITCPLEESDIYGRGNLISSRVWREQINHQQWEKLQEINSLSVAIWHANGWNVRSPLIILCYVFNLMINLDMRSSDVFFLFCFSFRLPFLWRCMSVFEHVCVNTQIFSFSEIVLK